MLDRTVPLVLLALSGVYLTQAMALPFGAVAKPGAGFYPVIVAVFAIVVAMAATATAFRAHAVEAGAEVELDAPARRKRVLISVLALVGFCFLMPWVGYPAVALLFTTIVLRFLGSRWATAVLIGVLSAAASYVLFAVLLDVPLPRGW